LKAKRGFFVMGGSKKADERSRFRGGFGDRPTGEVFCTAQIRCGRIAKVVRRR